VGLSCEILAHLAENAYKVGVYTLNVQPKR